jgi:hypothetical protein
MDKQEAIERIKERKLQYESIFSDLRNDKDVVIAAISYERNVLSKLPEVFKDNEGIVFHAIKKDYRQFEFASERIRSDFDIVKKALTIDFRIYQFISDELLGKLDLLKYAIEKSNGNLSFLGYGTGVTSKLTTSFYKEKEVFRYFLSRW